MGANEKNAALFIRQRTYTLYLVFAVCSCLGQQSTNAPVFRVNQKQTLLCIDEEGLNPGSDDESRKALSQSQFE
jgi:hypothetical protein